ncbi:MAG: hypothetical protein WC581_06385 [Thermodesulfovibrionales bacterium]
MIKNSTDTLPEVPDYSHLRKLAEELLVTKTLEKGIEREVITLLNAGIETFESCEGGKGYSYPEPTVRFYGDKSEGFKALATAMQNGLYVNALRRIWPIIEGEPTGPWWEMTFYQPKPCGN